ncbi:MAG: rhodanese-like domain-containing protein [Actinomycetota bacterium]
MSVTLKDMMMEARQNVDEIPPDEAKRRIDAGEVELVLDVREEGEWTRGHIPGAVHVPRGLLEIYADPSSPAAHPELTARKDARVVTYCWQAPGARSILAAHTLKRMGYENVIALAGGLKAWKEQALPLETEEE